MVIQAGSFGSDFQFPEYGRAFAWGAGQVFVVRQIPRAPKLPGLIDQFSPDRLGVVIDLITDDDGFPFPPSFSNLISFLDTPKVKLDSGNVYRQSFDGEGHCLAQEEWEFLKADPSVAKRPKLPDLFEEVSANTYENDDIKQPCEDLPKDSARIGEEGNPIERSQKGYKYS